MREWTGLEFAKSQRAVENREKWRKLIAKSSVIAFDFFPFFFFFLPESLMLCVI